MRLRLSLSALVLFTGVAGLAGVAGAGEPSCTIFALPGGNTFGTAGDDIICGTDGPDRIYSLGGDDIVYGIGGADVVFGGDGDDHLMGGTENDRLFGGNGDDLIEGGGGTDDLWGQNGDDQLDAGIESGDIARGGLGTDECAAATTQTCEGDYEPDLKCTVTWQHSPWVFDEFFHDNPIPTTDYQLPAIHYTIRGESTAVFEGCPEGAAFLGSFSPGLANLAISDGTTVGWPVVCTLDATVWTGASFLLTGTATGYGVQSGYYIAPPSLEAGNGTGPSFDRQATDADCAAHSEDSVY